MLKSCRGFSLIEVLAALAVFTIAATVAIPLLTQIYRERISVSQEREALAILQNHMQIGVLTKSSTEKNSVIQHSGTIYKLTWHPHKAEGTVEACISWKGSNERRYQKCGYARTPAVSP